MDEKINLKDDLVAEIKQEPETLDMTPLASFKSIMRQALGYDDLTPIDLTKHISVALRSSSGSNAIAEREADSDILRFFASGYYPAVSLKVSIVPVQEGTGDPSPDNIRTITGWTAVKVYQAAEYDEEAEPVLEIALGDDAGTVYGGVLDVITGVLTVTHVSVDMGTLTRWTVDTRYAHQLFTLPYLGNTRDRKNGTPIICSMYSVAPGTWGIASFGANGPDDSIAYHSTDAGVWVRDDSFSTLEEFLAGVTGQTIVYELSTPLTFELDPEELSTLTTLIGENNIWADCGPVESITY